MFLFVFGCTQTLTISAIPNRQCATGRHSTTGSRRWAAEELDKPLHSSGLCRQTLGTMQQLGMSFHLVSCVRRAHAGDDDVDFSTRHPEALGREMIDGEPMRAAATSADGHERVRCAPVNLPKRYWSPVNVPDIPDECTIMCIVPCAVLNLRNVAATPWLIAWSACNQGVAPLHPAGPCLSRARFLAALQSERQPGLKIAHTLPPHTCSAISGEGHAVGCPGQATLLQWRSRDCMTHLSQRAAAHVCAPSKVALPFP